MRPITLDDATAALREALSVARGLPTWGLGQRIIARAQATLDGLPGYTDALGLAFAARRHPKRRGQTVAQLGLARLAVATFELGSARLYAAEPCQELEARLATRAAYAEAVAASRWMQEEASVEPEVTMGYMTWPGEEVAP